ncbi:serendipity locus protein delta [Musca domestica]|uniref:Serendipity locus protein delta n=1 Tax=Musca domestica TaxID=7370 RepID=A0A9J7CYP6_MUSDO|nr:serendipity locus protein delta [Musca domestica]
MSHTMGEFVRCFLCRKKHTSPHKIIEGSICPASRKSVKTVLLHLARCGKFQLLIARGEWLCRLCFIKIVDYDTTFINLTRKQKVLTTLVEKAVTTIDSDIEAECLQEMSHMEEINDEHFFDDANVSDREIAETIFEVIGGNSEKKRKVTNHGKPRQERNIESAGSDSGEDVEALAEGETIQCNLCAMRFKNRTHHQRHVVQVHKKFSCKMCSFSHRNEDYVMLHMNIHEGKSENQCRFCNKEFTTKISTIRHMEVHMDTKKYQCDKCGLVFSQTTVLYNHKLQHEAEEKPLRCEICNQIFKTKRTFRHHMVTHRADRPRYSCEYCGKTFTEKYTLKVHKRTHPESGGAAVNQSDSVPNQYQNNQPQALQYEEHQVQAYNSSQVGYTQPQPSSTSSNNIGTKFGCIICDQHFNGKDSLNKHMEKEHDVILKSLSIANFTQYEVVTNESRKACYICGQIFSTQHNLDYHLVNVHEVTLK